MKAKVDRYTYLKGYVYKLKQMLVLYDKLKFVRKLKKQINQMIQMSLYYVVLLSQRRQQIMSSKSDNCQPLSQILFKYDNNRC